MTKALVVEDERDIRQLLVDNLFDFGYDVLESRDGGEAVQMASQELPDLILLDVMLPVMDGFKVLRELRENPLTEAIPVILLTVLGHRKANKKRWTSVSDITSPNHLNLKRCVRRLEWLSGKQESRQAKRMTP